MSFISEYENTVSRLLKLTGIPRFGYFLYVSAWATAGVVYFLVSTNGTIDWNDSGVQVIMAIVAASCYACIWMYIKHMTQRAGQER